MMLWPNDYRKVAQQPGVDTMLQPLNDYVNWMVDCHMWTCMQLWAAPFMLPGHMGEIERWTRTVSLNGIKSFNLCQN
jgi:hypothetical protein